MKKFDLILITIVSLICIWIINSFLSAIFIVKAIVGLITLVVLLYWKLSPYKHQLSPKYFKYYSYVETGITPVWNLFQNVPRIQLGQGLAMDSAPVIISSILILILIVL